MLATSMILMSFLKFPEVINLMKLEKLMKICESDSIHFLHLHEFNEFPDAINLMKLVKLVKVINPIFTTCMN